jgi:short-chain fatty acids transporter
MPETTAQEIRGLSGVALRLTAWMERYLPDAFVFALVATVVVVALALALTPSSPATIVTSWGNGFWDLIAFTLQMALIIVTGYVLATAKPVGKLVARLGALPRTPRQAALLVALFSMITSWVNWGFALIFSAMLARQIARRRPECDYRMLAATSLFGIGSIWAQGLSSSAALQMASAGSLQAAIREVVAAGGLVPGGVIPLRHTIFLWQSFFAIAVEIAVVAVVAVLLVPHPRNSRGAASLGIDLGEDPSLQKDEDRPLTPGERMEHSPVLTVFVAAMGFAWLGLTFAKAQDKLGAVNLNTVNFAFLMLGCLLQGTPARLMRAVKDSTPAIWAVILQFPFYAGIAGIIVGTGLNARIADAFVALSSRVTFAPVIAVYSLVLGVFVPSAGSKWVIEAPYVMAASHQLHVHLGWTVSVYNLGEALANMIQPFWMLPTLAIFGLRAKDVMGYTCVLFLVLTPVVLALVTLLALTLPYPL